MYILEVEYNSTQGFTTKSPIVLYQEGTTRQGDFAGGLRSTADSLCSASGSMPSGFSNYRAFVSLSATDEIANFPTLYFVPTDVPIISISDKVVASNWSDLLDGTINDTLFNLDVMWDNAYWWSGSTNTAELSTDYCAGFTGFSDNTSGVNGTIGYSKNSGSSWMSSGLYSCDYYNQVLCIAFDN